jgi:hypothetical protein
MAVLAEQTPELRDAAKGAIATYSMLEKQVQ